MATQTKLVTYDDYQNLPDDGNRYEIIGGELFMTSAPKTAHQQISLKLSSYLFNHDEKNQLGEVLTAPFEVALSMTDIVQPDIIFVSSERSEIITEKNIVAAPDMVVEILSESTEVVDRNQKKDLYEKYGVKEYWIVAPEEKQIEQYVLEGNSYAQKEIFNRSDSSTSQVISGFELPLEDLFSN